MPNLKVQKVKVPIFFGLDGSLKWEKWSGCLCLRSSVLIYESLRYSCWQKKRLAKKINLFLKKITLFNVRRHRHRCRRRWCTAAHYCSYYYFSLIVIAVARFLYCPLEAAAAASAPGRGGYSGHLRPGAAVSGILKNSLLLPSCCMTHAFSCTLLHYSRVKTEPASYVHTGWFRPLKRCFVVRRKCALQHIFRYRDSAVFLKLLLSQHVVIWKWIWVKRMYHTYTCF